MRRSGIRLSVTELPQEFKSKGPWASIIVACVFPYVLGVGCAGKRTLNITIGLKQEESYCYLQRRLQDSLSDFPVTLLDLAILMDGLRASKWESQPLLNMSAGTKKDAWRRSGFYTDTPRADMPTSRFFFSMKKQTRCACL